MHGPRFTEILCRDNSLLKIAFCIFLCSISQPLEIDFIYWNQKYCNFSNALNYRDGVAVVSIPIAVVSIHRFIMDMRSESKTGVNPAFRKR